LAFAGPGRDGVLGVAEAFPFVGAGDPASWSAGPKIGGASEGRSVDRPSVWLLQASNRVFLQMIVIRISESSCRGDDNVHTLPA